MEKLNSLFLMVHRFLMVFLTEEKKCSPNTVRSYRKALELLFDYVKEQRGVSLGKVTFDMIDRELMADFLNYLEQNRGCSTVTRNHRLECIRAFYKYAAQEDIALVKEVKADTESRDLEKLASSIADTLSSEFYTHCVVGIGTTVTGIKDLARSFKEAQSALEVAKVFDTERTIVSYDNLGIARLIYQLPTTLCKMFLKEVFKRGSIESLDQETLFTIQRFFENNLNVSETSRKLFVHRNTLVYRLEKIKKLTGLDLREFEDAIVFKVALMVKKYLNASPTKY